MFVLFLQLSGRTARGSSGLSGVDSFSTSLNFVKTAVRALVEAPEAHDDEVEDDECDDDDDIDDDDDGSSSESSESQDSGSDNEEITRGVAQNSTSASSSSSSSLDSLLAARPKRCCLVLVLEHFEAFAEEGRQTLLYSLLDLRHEKGLHLVVVAVSNTFKSTSIYLRCGALFLIVLVMESFYVCILAQITCVCFPCELAHLERKPLCA